MITFILLLLLACGGLGLILFGGAMLFFSLNGRYVHFAEYAIPVLLVVAGILMIWYAVS